MNVLTFDIEEWYLEMTFHGGRAYRYKMFDEAFGKVLDELDRHGIKGTFFCVGKLAKDFPKVVKKIASEGHEIGCHSNVHTWLNKMTEEELRLDTMEAVKALEDVSGQKVTSYRAPAFSITNKNKWAVNVLADCGIECDASIYPTNRDFGGYKGFPQDTPCIISHEGATLKEYPVCLTSLLGKQMAYSGGGYFRILPYRFISNIMKNRDYNICYFHLNDLLTEKSKLMSKEEHEEYFKEPGTLKNRLKRYAKRNAGRGDTMNKLCRLLEEHSFVSLETATIQTDWAKIPVIEL